MKRLHLLGAVPLVLFLVGIPLAVALGGPGQPPPLASINDPFKGVDFSDLPPVSRFPARDGAKLAFRRYPAAGSQALGSVTLVHGSSASSASLHVLAKALASAGYTTCALDLRGHGESGTRGSIAYVGQLEDDLEDFLKAVQPAPPSTLAGFSMGGGFALRVAGGPRQGQFTNYLLMSPFLGPNAPNFRPKAGGWVKVGIPRIVALAMLNGVGITAFNDLPVLRFALSEEAKSLLTPHYSYTLAQNFQPQRDYRANLRAVGRPLRVVAGVEDELFYTDRLAAVLQREGQTAPVVLVPGVGHVTLTLRPAGLRAVLAQLADLNGPRG